MTITDRRSGSASASTASSRLGGLPEGLGVKAPVYLATTANITLNGVQTIDGVSATAGKRVLVKDQTTASENGIYDVAAGNWERSPDFSTNGDVVEGTRVWVTDGTVNAGTEWFVTTADDITIGTSSLTFEDAMLNDTSSIVGDTNRFWYTGSNGANVHKLNRLLVGEATVGGRSAPPSPADWLETMIAGTTQNAQLASINAIGLIGNLGATRSSDYYSWSGLSNGEGVIGVAGYGINDDTHNQTAYGGYFQANRDSGAGPAWGVETEIANFGSVPDVDPYTWFPTGYNASLLVASGAGYPYATDARVPNNASTAIAIADNGAKFEKGIIFRSSALDTANGAGGGGIAMELASGQSLRWLSAASTVGAELYGTSAGLTTPQSFFASGVRSDGLVNSYNFYAFNSGGGTTGFFLNSANTVGFQVVATDASGGFAQFGTTTAHNVLIFRNNSTALSIASGLITAQSSYAVSVASTTAATSTTTGALVVSGGVGVAGAVWAGGYLSRVAPVTETGTTHTVAATTTHLICNNSGSVTVTLPAAASFSGREIYIKNIDGTATVVSASSNVIPKAGGAAGTAILAAADGAWAFLVSNGSNWEIMAGS
jgi:hypothetical protein